MTNIESSVGGYWLLGILGFLRFDFLMELINAAIALAISAYALRCLRLTKDRIFLWLQTSFLLIGVGSLVHAVTTIFAIQVGGMERARFEVLGLGYTLDFLTQVVAYIILGLAYLEQTRSLALTPALVIFPRIRDYNPFTEIILFFLLVYIASQTALSYLVKKNVGSLLVSLGFGLLAVSHLFFVFTTYQPILFLLGHLVQTSGFILFLVALLRVRMIK